MQKRPWEISDLLALRDGEPRDAALSLTDPDVAADVARLDELRAELRALPDVPVAEEVWSAAIAQPQPRSAWLRFPLATAASVFFASVVGIYLLFGQPFGANEAPQPFAGTGQIDASGQQLAALMNRSRDLELRLQGAEPLMLSQATSQAADVQPNRRATLAERRLLFRLADVDAQIARLYEAEVLDSQRRELLWSQRVELLESLVAVRGGTDPRLFEDSRSM